jgi:hypothetical protein
MAQKASRGTAALQSAQMYIDKLKNANPISCVLLQTLTVELRTQKLSFVEDFVNLNGIHLLTLHLAAVNDLERKTESDYANQADLVKCFASTLKSEIGLKKFLNSSETLPTVVLSMYDCTIKTRTSILLLLSLLCQHSTDAFSLTLDTINTCKVVKREDARFSMLVGSLTEHNDVEYKIHLLIFFNVLLNSANDPVTRYEIIQDLNRLGIQQKLKQLDHITAHDFLTQKRFLMEQLHEDFSDQISNPVDIVKLTQGNLNVEGQSVLKDILHIIMSLSSTKKLYDCCY